jgi:hypothetical protein
MKMALWCEFLVISDFPVLRLQKMKMLCLLMRSIFTAQTCVQDGGGVRGAATESASA